MAPELAKKEATVEAEVDDILIRQLLTTIVVGLGKFRFSRKIFSSRTNSNGSY